MSTTTVILICSYIVTFLLGRILGIYEAKKAIPRIIEEYLRKNNK